MARTRVTLHKYPGEVLAEVVVDDGQGDVRTTTVAFDVVGDAGTLAPREALPAEHADHIRERIEASAYDLGDSQPRARP